MYRIPVQITDHLTRNAMFVRWPRRRILLAKDATAMLSEKDLSTLIAHESAHAELWHVEVNMAYTAVAVGIAAYFAVKDGISTAALFVVLASILLRVMRLAQEIEADSFTDRHSMLYVLKTLSTSDTIALRIRMYFLSREPTRKKS